MAAAGSRDDELVIKSPNDQRSYRLLRLANGLCALLVHDPEIYADGYLPQASKAHEDEEMQEEEGEDDEDSDEDDAGYSGEEGDDDDGEDEDEDEDEDVEWEEEDDGSEPNKRKEKGGSEPLVKKVAIDFLLFNHYFINLILGWISITLLIER